MVQRTQITLDPELHRLARRRAADRGLSLAEYIRRLVARDLQPSLPEADRSLVFDLGNSGGSDIASGKREYVGEAVEAEWLAERGRG